MFNDFLPARQSEMWYATGPSRMYMHIYLRAREISAARINVSRPGERPTGGHSSQTQAEARQVILCLSGSLSVYTYAGAALDCYFR